MSEKKFKIGVMGGAGGTHSENAIAMTRKLGQEIAKKDCFLFYGATIGLPLEAAMAAKKAGCFVVGVSPGSDSREHEERYKMPHDTPDLVIFTGMGLAGGRNTILVKSCDAVIIVGGRIGTMNEFSVAYPAGKVIGVLEGTGGFADKIREIEKILDDRYGAKIIYDTDPEKLVDRVIAELKNKK